MRVLIFLNYNVMTKKKKETITSVVFRILDIETLQFSYNDEIIYEELNGSEFIANIALAIDFEDRVIFNKFSFELEKIKKSLIKIEVQLVFSFEKKSWESFIKLEELQIPKQIAEHLSALNVSSTRGILKEKLLKTNLSEFILPLINVREIIEEDPIFNIEKVKE